MADEIGVDVDDVEVVHGDTDRTPMGWGTYGSRTTVVSGAAVALAVRKIKDKATQIAAHLLEAAVEDIDYEDGKFFVRGSPDQAQTIQDIALMANVAWNMPEGVEPGLEASTFYDPPNFSYPFGTHIAVVEVDAETGGIELKRYLACDDCGPQINPMIVEGQIHGGVVQGIGPVLCEGAVYDDDGQLLTGSMLDYALQGPTCCPRSRPSTASPRRRTIRWGSRASGDRHDRVDDHRLQRGDGRAQALRRRQDRHADNPREGLAGDPRERKGGLGHVSGKSILPPGGIGSRRPSSSWLTTKTRRS